VKAWGVCPVDLLVDVLVDGDHVHVAAGVDVDVDVSRSITSFL
jgi:hypothetical protein